MKNNLVRREEFNINTPYKAKQMANVLAQHIKDNKLSVNIQGHDYVQVEGWQFAGGLMGLFPQITEVKELGPMRWMAKSEITNAKTGKIVSVGYAICSKEEFKKKGFDEYAILSQAQTRATGKAFRNYIGWIIKMAGYQATPAEEIKPEIVDKVVAEKGAKTNATSYKEQLKAELFKSGAKTEPQAIATLVKKTGISATNFESMTEKEAQIKLFAYLNTKK